MVISVTGVSGVAPPGQGVAVFPSLSLCGVSLVLAMNGGAEGECRDGRWCSGRRGGGGAVQTELPLSLSWVQGPRVCGGVDSS